MARFTFFGNSIDLPAVPASGQARSDPACWLAGHYVTVRLTEPLSLLRVHTNDHAYPGLRPSSPEAGGWLLLGDDVLTRSEIADSRSLPIANPRSMVAFTRASEASVAAGTILNIGAASALFGGGGGGLQAQYVSGPPIRFTPLKDKHWHDRAGRA